MPRRLLLVPAIAIAALGALTGCSSSGSSPSASTPPISPSQLTATAYRLQLHGVAVQQNQAQHDIQAALHAKTVAQLRAALSTFATDESSAASRLEGLVPPADATGANAELAKAFNDNAAAIQSLVAELAHAKSVKQAMKTIQNDTAAQRVGAEIDTALKKLRQLGYTHGS